MAQPINPHPAGTKEAADWDAYIAKAASCDFSTSKMLDCATSQPITYYGNLAMREWYVAIDICRRQGVLLP